MSPEAQRIAIAKACGWSFWQNQFETWVATRPDGKEVTMPGTPEQAIVGILDRFGLPNYLGDLNAIYEAEQILDKGQKIIRICTLYRIVIPKEEQDDRYFIDWNNAFKLVDATAPQRCEAFLRTLSLWTE